MMRVKNFEKFQHFKDQEPPKRKYMNPSLRMKIFERDGGLPATGWKSNEFIRAKRTNKNTAV